MMTLTPPSLYQLKKTLMYPRKLYMRHKENLEPGFMRSALELHYYRPAFYKWLKAISNDRRLLHDANIDSNSIVLDAGAYQGEWAQEIMDLYSPTIYAFEPDPRNFKKLNDRSRINPRLISLNVGLGNKNERVTMTQEYLGSSVVGEGGEKPGVPTAEVELQDIAATFEELELKRVDFMKINIEGAEFPLLERMIATNLLSRVDCFLIQYHEWHPGAYRRRKRIQQAMSKTHRPVWDYHFVWEKWVLK